MVAAADGEAVEKLDLYTDYADYTESRGVGVMQSQMPAWKSEFEGKHSELSKKILKVFFEVHTELGFGFSEKVYQKAYAIALREAGMKVDEQVPIKVYFRGQLVGEFFADMVVNGLILLELKSVNMIVEESVLFRAIRVDPCTKGEIP
ncbi:MAG: hypothetical protein OHK0041_02960 [Anaerolineales bacterium]